MIDTTHTRPKPPTADDDLRDEASARVSALVDNGDSTLDTEWPDHSEDPVPASPQRAAPAEHAVAATQHPATTTQHPAAKTQLAATSARSTLLMAAIAAGVITVALISVIAAPRMRTLMASAPVRGQLTLLSDTPARVSIDGADRGSTPLELTLDAGPHAVRVSSGADVNTMTVVITSGSREVHHVHTAMSPAPLADTGGLRITTPEAGARIVLDGEFRGLTPMSFAALTPGVHHISVVTPGKTIRRDITIEPQRTIDLELMPTAVGTAGSGASGGWLVVSSPFDVEIWENGALIGSSRSARIMLNPGRHSIDVVSQLLGYRDHRTIAVTAGQNTSLRVAAPQGTLSVNATPWADVWVDGTRVGETPIGEIPLSIGSHDVLLRHPEFGERRVQSLVRVGEVTRVIQDLRQSGTRP